MTKSPIEQAREFAANLTAADMPATAKAITDLINYAESLERKVEELEKKDD